MSTETQSIVAQVLALPLPVRKEVLTQLIKSMDLEGEPTLEEQSAIDTGWELEIARRIQEVKEGKAELLDGDSAMDEIRKKFGV